MGRWVRRLGLAVVLSLLAAGGAAYPAQAASLTSAQLDALRGRLARLLPVGSVSSLDEATGKVELRVAGQASAALTAALAGQRDHVRVIPSAPVQDMELLYGGHGIEGTRPPREHCTSGFIASQGAANSIITAGHCTADAVHWERKGNYVGDRVLTVYGPEGDYGVIEEKGVKFTPRGMVNTPFGFPILIQRDTVVDAYVGQQLCKMGNTTKFTCGTVTKVDAWVTKEEFIMEGLIETTICADHGDSGGPLMTPYQVGPAVFAYGVGILANRSNGPCTNPQMRTYFQPLQEILDSYGLQLGEAL